MESNTRRMYRMRSRTEVLTEVVGECCCRSQQNRNPAALLDDPSIRSTIKSVFKECMNEEVLPKLEQIQRLLVEVCANNQPYYGTQFPGQENIFAAHYAWNTTKARSTSDGCWPTYCGKGYEEKTTYGRQRSQPVENQDTENVSIKINSPVNISNIAVADDDVKKEGNHHLNIPPDRTFKRSNGMRRKDLTKRKSFTEIQDDLRLHQTSSDYDKNDATIGGSDNEGKDIDDSGVPCNKPERERKDVAIQTLLDDDTDRLVIVHASPVVTCRKPSQPEKILEHDEANAILNKDEPMANPIEDNLDAILYENKSTTIPNEDNFDAIPNGNESANILNKNDLNAIPDDELDTIPNEAESAAVPNEAESAAVPNEDESAAVPNEDNPEAIVPNKSDAEAIPNDDARDAITNEVEEDEIGNDDEMDMVTNEDEQEGISNEDEPEAMSMNTTNNCSTSIVQRDSFDSVEPWQQNDETRKFLLGDLNYHDRLRLERSLDGRWDMLSKGMVDKYFIPLKQIEIDACMYPGCKRIGWSFFECLATVMPDLMVERFCQVAKNHRRNDISSILDVHNGELLTDIPLLVRNHLEILCGLSHYTHKEGNWKLFAEELGVEAQSIDEIAQVSFDISNRSHCDEIIDLLKTKAPRLSVQDMVETLRELGICGSADSLEELISDKENENQYKRRLTIRSISICDAQINYAIL